MTTLHSLDSRVLLANFRVGFFRMHAQAVDLNLNVWLTDSRRLAVCLPVAKSALFHFPNAFGPFSALTGRAAP
jgi:hypothetical protein